MNDQVQTPLRKLILSGTYRQYRYWLAANHANRRAAVYVDRPEQFLGMDPEECEIVLADGHRDNPAYMSNEHVYFLNRRAEWLGLKQLAS